MNILAIWTAKSAALVPGLAIGVPAAVRADGLDGFALGALLSGASFLVVTSQRLSRLALATRRALAWRGAPVTSRERTAGTAGAHRSPPRWARTGRPRAEIRRVMPRHAAPQAGLASRMTGLLPGRAMAGAGMPGGGRD